MAGTVLLAVASVLALMAATGIALWGPAPARAADTSALEVVGATRYEAQPDAGRIAVTSELTITNRAVDTATTHYFYDQAFLAVPTGASSFAVSGGIGRPTVTVSERKDTYTLLAIAFGGRLTAGETTTIRLVYALPDPGDPPDRDVRASRTLITFPAWALASTGTPGASVTVVIPAGYRVTFPQGSIDGPTIGADGAQVWTSGPIADPLKFDLVVRADKPVELVSTDQSVTIDGRAVRLTFRSWPDDPAWLTRMEDLYRAGIPRLAQAIGLSWPLEGSLTIEETLDPPAEGIAGTFDPSTDSVKVAYWAGPELALHEAAHIWFNGGFLADRWANEAFAAYYAEQVAGELGLPFEPAVITPQLQASSIPLNAWGEGSAAPQPGAERSTQEAYGYAAAVLVARRIADQVGPTGLTRVWAAIDARVAPYQPSTRETERLTGPPDWRTLLDLLGDGRTTQLPGLWATYVVRPEEAGVLADRTIVRREYDATVRRAGDWVLPRSIRDAMRGWQFAVAHQQLGLAGQVLDARDELAAATAAAGLTMPTGLGRLFSGASDLSTVVPVVQAESRAAPTIAGARRARPAHVGFLEWAGLWLATPEQSLRDAVAAFDAADPGKASALAAEARDAWEHAADVGRARIVGLAVLVFVLLLLVAASIALLRRRRGTSAP